LMLYINTNGRLRHGGMLGLSAKRHTEDEEKRCGPNMASNRTGRV
jgi:hypothetical protein